MPRNKTAALTPEAAKTKPAAPQEGAPDKAWDAYFHAILKWLRKNKIPATVGDFCAHAGVSRSKYGRRAGEEVKALVNTYSRASYPGRWRPQPPGTLSPQTGHDRRVHRERERFARENEVLRARLEKAEAEVERLRGVVAAAGEAVPQLQVLVDTLLYELCKDQPARAKEVGRIVGSVRDRTIPAEFMDAMQEVVRGFARAGGTP